ncbi:MAG: cyclic nucleotide-binding domain-containing protein [Acidobacteria bacterium]|nr:cyclic nucleotide-binding domain-containing protein [Acidobacteriota bacterium]MCA1637768.1 cyclic nucleotide-binding domain-containing protein [Acidobacteriota bacterium]
MFAEGEAAIFLPLIISGKVKMVHFLELGKEVIISIFQKGEMFAVPPVFDGEPSGNGNCYHRKQTSSSSSPRFFAAS